MLDSVKANYGRSASFLKSLVGRTIKLETAPAGAKSTEAPEDGLAEAVERISAAWVKGAYYETLGREPITGRLLRAADDRPDAPSLILLDSSPKVECRATAARRACSDFRCLRRGQRGYRSNFRVRSWPRSPAALSRCSGCPFNAARLSGDGPPLALR